MNTRMLVSNITFFLTVLLISSCTPFPRIKKKLFLSSIRGNITKVKKLIEKGANVNAQDIEGFTALMKASVKEKKELSDDNVMADKVKMLMERVQVAEEKMRAAEQERNPLKRANNSLKQEMKLIEARAQKAERQIKELTAV